MDIAAADATDKFHQPSRDLLRKVVTDGIAVIQPAFGRAEVPVLLLVGFAMVLRGSN